MQPPMQGKSQPKLILQSDEDGRWMNSQLTGNYGLRCSRTRRGGRAPHHRKQRGGDGAADGTNVLRLKVDPRKQTFRIWKPND